MTTSFGVKTLALAALSLTVMAGGCRSESDAPKAKTLEGRVIKVDVESGIVTGRFFLEKQGQEIELSGKLAPDAEILINGETATLKQVQPDDRVVVIGWQEKRDNEQKLIAKRVEITRPTSSTHPAGGTPRPGPGTAPAR